MKKKVLGILIGSFCVAMLAAGCKKGELPTDYYFVAESESGDVLLSLDEDGNILSFLDEDGNSIDLTDCVIEKDNDGNVVAVFLADGSKVSVKEKASEEVVNQVLQGGSINLAENSPEKKPENTSEKKSEKESEVESEKTSEVKSEKTEKTSEIEGLVPGVNAPALPKSSTNPSQSGISEKVQKQIEQIKANTLAEMEKERGLDDSKISAAIGIVMYTRTDDTGGMIKVYRGPGEEYGVVEDNGGAASISTFPFREFAVQVLASTDNGWYKIKYSSTKSRYAFEIAAEHDVEGYVRQTDLVSEDENTTRVAEREKQAAAIREQAELETEKYEKELAEKEKKLKEKEEKKEKASEKTSEKDSEKESEKASEEKSEEVSEKASETTSEVASEIPSETEITSEDNSEEISSEVSSEQKEPVSEIGSEKSSEINGNEKTLNGGEKEKEENGSEKKEE